MSVGDSEKEKGNAAFRNGDYATALKHYDQEIENAGSDARAVLFSNKAAALQKLERYDLCIQQCLKGLAAPGLTTELKSKIHFRIVLAYEANGKLEDALEAIQNCEGSPTILEKKGDLIAKLLAGNPEAMRTYCNRLLLENDRFSAADTKAMTSILDWLVDRIMEEPDAARRHSSLVDRSMPSRSEMILAHERFLQIYKGTLLSQHRSKPVRFDTFSLGSASGHVSTALLYHLEPITIGQMRLDEVNVGKLLICRTITEPFMLHALTTLIEDPTGEVRQISIYNLCSPTEDVNSLVPAGMYLAIKEPWYKTSATDGKPAIRVDNPVNLVYLELTHDLLKKVKWQTSDPQLPSLLDGNLSETWQSCEKRANELFVAGNYALAVAAYSDAIELKRCRVPMKEMADLLANRAAAFLGDGKPTDAFWDCSAALNVQPGHLKATFRLAKAHGKLGKYELAKQVLASSPHTTRLEFQTEIARLNRLIGEQRNGDYDLKALLKEAAERIRIDHADYIGGVRVQWISEAKGNGLFALRDFAPGELLFASKAFMTTNMAERIGGNARDADESIRNDDLHSECVSRIVRRISNNQELVKELYQLFAGPHFERLRNTDKDDAPAVDVKRVAAIVHHNAFGLNGIAAEPSRVGRPGADLPGTGFSFDGCGVWIRASFMNHSCVPNTEIFYVADFMFARAAKRIRKGEELTTSYTDRSNSYSRRHDALERYGFKCECELCVGDLKRNEDQPYLADRRQTFLDSFDDKFSHQLYEAANGKTSRLAKLTEDARKLAEEFANLLAHKNRCDRQLECLYSGVAYGYTAQQKWLQAAKFHELAYFAAVGKGIKSGDTFISNALPVHVLLHCLGATKTYLLGREFVKAKAYFGKLRRAAKVCWGSADKELLALLYPGLPVRTWFDRLT